MQALPRRIGPYEVEGTLGQGGMGTVLRVRHAQLGVARALKVLTERTSPTGAARFAREVGALAALHHPNVVALHEAGEVNGLPYYVMDLVEGEPLDRVLARGAADLDRALAIGVDVCRGVEALHAAGIVHRDLKPQNVMLTRDGRAVVIDLGLAIAPDRDQRLTRTGATLGTPSYMAPEQVAAAPATPRTDVHALGLILFELLTGRVALDGTSIHEVMGKIIAARRPRPSELVPDLPAALDAVVIRAMHHDPAQRHAHAGLLGAELEALRGGARPLSGRALRRRAAALLALAVLGVAGGVAAVARRPDDAPVAAPGGEAPAPPAVAATPAGPPRLAVLDPPERPELPEVLRGWSIVGPETTRLALRLDASGGAVELEHVHRGRGAPRPLRACAVPPGALVELALATGWNEVVVTLRPPRPAAPIAVRRSIVRLPAGLEPVAAGGPWLEVSRAGRPTDRGKPDRLVLVPPGRTRVVRPLAGSLTDATSEAEVPLPYLIGRLEVTRGQFLAACREGQLEIGRAGELGQAPPDADPAELPVVFVNQVQAAAYCALRDLRLPASDEWERAYTGGLPARQYPWGATWEPRRLNRWCEGFGVEADADGYLGCVAPVGQFPDGASLFGALDMAGNVFEWVEVEERDGVRHAAKYGGAFDTADARASWPGYRTEVDVNETDVSLGFRVARSVGEVP